MFGWRRRRDGFEWKQYVRTTILVRRERRRQRIDELRESAIDNLKEAGRKGVDAGVAGLDAAQREARRGVGAAVSAFAGRISNLGRRAGPALSRLPRLRSLPLSRLMERPRRLVDRVHVTAGSWHLDNGLVQVVLLIGSVIAGTGLYGWWSTRADSTRTASLVQADAPAPPSELSGRATATTGDTLRIGATTVRLAGIEAPDHGQACARTTGKRWDCGQAATQALARLVRGKPVTCAVSGRDAGGRPLATCKAGDQDIAAALVSDGAVFAEAGMFAPYPGVEARARDAHAGIWAGTAERPAVYRAKLWEDAKKASPEGCPIKGHVKSGARIYLLPWAPGYDRAKVRSGRGERWFCSEKEALAAGWKPGPGSPHGSS